MGGKVAVLHLGSGSVKLDSAGSLERPRSCFLCSVPFTRSSLGHDAVCWARTWTAEGFARAVKLVMESIGGSVR